MYYPRWKYHRSEPAVIVETPEAEAKLGAEWSDTPAAFDEPEAGQAQRFGSYDTNPLPKRKKKK